MKNKIFRTPVTNNVYYNIEIDEKDYVKNMQTFQRELSLNIRIPFRFHIGPGTTRSSIKLILYAV